MLSTYPAIFFMEKNGSCSVVFPDLNHLSTDGADMKEAMEMAVDCLAGYLYSAKLDGEQVPPPTPLNEVDIHSEDDEDEDKYEFINVQYVPVDVEEYAAKHFEKTIRKSLTIPKWMDEKAKTLGINFSQALRDGLTQEFQKYEAGHY